MEKACIDTTEKDYNKPFQVKELTTAIDSIKSKSSIGSDLIDNRFITNLPTQIKIELWTTYNIMYKESIVPASWKTADIIPILKPGKNPTEPKPYRPISLLSCAGKIMERMVGKRLRWYLEQNKILLPYQFGFRRGKSTLAPPAIFEHEIQMSFRTQKLTIVVLLDLTSAFDKADVMAILYKLATNGMKGKVLASGSSVD